ncbi:integrase [Streptosporangium jomthongense]|uniref:Tyrosine-type recombinase/integrase n=1 Tax=Marinobacter aromaticivorans TaxID=1494078 RepID=A0ABW2IZP8_9GAMM|nr:tyrosine-type recombinase/integrase [Marinobacter aromaticivorans]GGE79984.1 integrase [Streptosporangium jomthongense]
MNTVSYQGPLAEYMEGLLQHKRALGFHYDTPARTLRHFDQFCITSHWTRPSLDESLVEGWNQKRPHEAHATWKGRIQVVRQLALYMARLGLPAYVTPVGRLPKGPRYVPHIFSAAELRAFFCQVDACAYCPEVPYRHLTMPLLFRLLYGCGLRVSEILHLRIADVDPDAGVLTIRDTKFHKDRLVPVTEGLQERLLRYFQQVHRFSGTNECVFWLADHHPLSVGNVYKNFRRFLWHAGISHGGWGKGPRVHDFRHTFAVHCLKGWVRDSKDLAAYLPLLKTYLGHYSFQDSAYYLRLTADLYPDITVRVEQSVGYVVPDIEGGSSDETD